MKAENTTVEQCGALEENYPRRTTKIPNGQFKMRAVFNTGRTTGCRDFDLSVLDGKSYALVGILPTTAGNQKVWKKLETSQILLLKGTHSHYCYPEPIKLPATLRELWTELYGHVRPFAHREDNGIRFVQVGNTIYHSNPDRNPWRYTTDFLKFFAEQILGREWFLEEARKPDDRQHQIAKLHNALYGQLKGAVPDQAGEYSFLPCGASNYFFNLAYDLFVLQDAGALNASVIHRLKNKSGFQGARHEIFVAATCLRAGFNIEHDNETDGTTRHVEFAATHGETRIAIAVEAKSRHRQGVLDHNGEGRSVTNPKAGVVRLLNDAIDKAKRKPIRQPYVNLHRLESSSIARLGFREALV